MNNNDLSQNNISQNDISNNNIIIQKSTKHVELYKILDHCGCSIVGKIQQNRITNILYTYICDTCFLSITFDDYKYIINYFSHDMRYPVKELMSHREWLDEKTWYRSMHHLKHSKTKMYNNGKQYFTNFILPLLNETA